MKHSPSTEERVWATVSHLSAILFGVGLLLPVIGWSTQRRKSNYATFQCLQALGYQSLGYTIWILATLVVVIIQSLGALGKLIAAADSGANFEQLTAMSLGGQFSPVFIFSGLYILFPIVAAIACAFGVDFRYPLLGNRLARYLGFDPNQSTEGADWLNEDHEDRWVAGMGHFCVIVIFWGMLVPSTAWILQGKHSLFLRFQSIQTLVYQVTVIALNVGAVVLYVIGAVVLLSVIGISAAPDLNSSAVMTGFVVFIISSLIALLIILFIPLMHILGQWAGYRVLKGDDYHYPLIGKWIEREVSKNSKPV